MTLNRLYKKLRKNSRGQYILLGFCCLLSILLITSFSLMYFSPTVQNFLPEGGDTRKMASLLFGVTAVGCFIFTVYASNLFFRNKAREYGVLMALGLKKRELKKLLFRELSLITAASSLLGFLLSAPVSYVIWKIFQLFIISNEQMTYHLGLVGLIPGILFSIVLALVLGLVGWRFVNRSHIMEALRIQQKTEMVREIKGHIFPTGVALTLLGILLGSGLPQFTARVLSVNLPSIFSCTYLLSVVGIYLMLLSIVSQSRLKKNKKKYYGNLVSISLMRFTAKATTRNMCVTVLLLFVCCFSAFYGMQYSITPNMLDQTKEKTFSMHYPVEESQINRQDITDTASRHQLKIQDFAEDDGANLVISYNALDFNANGTKYVRLYKENDKTALFLSQETFENLTGIPVSVSQGTYKTVTTESYSEFFNFVDGLKEVMNPDTGESWELTYDGMLEYNALATMSEPFTYILNTEDYQAMTAKLDDDYRERLVFFNVSDVEDSYDFARDLLSQYVAHASDRSNHLGYWDIWEQKLADASGEEYRYGDPIDMNIHNNMLLGDWKYAPQFNILTVQDRMQLISVYVMLCLYIFIISLAAIGVMTYVRSISIAMDNRELFESLSKLGAGNRYRRDVLKKQLAKIFQYPGFIGCGLSFLFALTMDLLNDGRLTGTEITALAILIAMMLAIAVILYAVYRHSIRSTEKIVGIQRY